MDKCKIIVHNPCNDITRHFKNYNFFWDYFTEFLKQYFDVEENRYFEDIHKMPYNVNLKKGFTNNLNVYDCEYIIENKETGDFHIISVSDIETSAMLNEASNPFCKNILVSQFNPKRLFMWKNEIPHKDIAGKEVRNYFFKFKPWCYFQSSLINLDPFYYKRKYIKNKKEELFFRGSALNERVFLTFLDKKYVTEFSDVNEKDYFEEIINHKIALSIDGKGEFCYRDIECFALGVPIIRFEYESSFDQILIPNYHYISIPRPTNMNEYKEGTKEHAELLIESYLHAVKNEELLNFISKNARKYYEDNLIYSKIASRTFSLLNLQAWSK